MDKQTVIAAFELIRKHGFTEAQRLSDGFRDMNAQGTISYALHNAVSKQIAEFADSGSAYRPV